MTRRFSLITAISLAFAAAGSASAAPSAQPGMQVKDTTGAAVGTVVKLDGELVTVKTDKFEVPLPLASFAQDGNSLLISMSQVALNAEWEKRLAASEASLAVGATVNGSKGTPVGTIAAIDAENVTIELTGGKKVQLPRHGIAGSPSGAVIGFTAEELLAKVGS